MSRLAVALPKTEIQKREADTIELIKALRAKGFSESKYEKPFRIFKKDQYLVRFNVRDGIVCCEHTPTLSEVSATFFRGQRYALSIEYVQNL